MRTVLLRGGRKGRISEEGRGSGDKVRGRRKRESVVVKYIISRQVTGILSYV